MNTPNILSPNRDKAIKSYYLNPKKCKFCNKIIEIRGRKVSDVRKTTFCDIVCSGKYTAIHHKKLQLREQSFCADCNKEIWHKSTRCKSCQGKNVAENHLLKTKKELKKDTKYWVQYRSRICKHARKTYKMSDKPKQCYICGYERHYEVCHVKDVSKFSDDTPIGEINHLDNLIALCPNHHWEFDNEIIEISFR